MTGRMNLKGRTSIARVSRAHEMRAAFGGALLLMLLSGEGTSHRGVMRERPDRRRRKVIPKLVELEEREI